MSLHPAAPDTLYLWYLGQPEAPMLAGTLNLVMNRRSVSLRYSDAWLKDGFALSEDLPLTDIEHFPRDKDSAAEDVFTIQAIGDLKIRLHAAEALLGIAGEAIDRGLANPTEEAVNDATVKTVRRDEPKLGRNDPCWCGSGTKYTKCHGA